jgi:two-component system sensor histidine kinase TctE
MRAMPSVEASAAPRTQRVLRSLCHAIRQPLTAIQARAELLEDGAFGEPPPAQRSELSRLQADCARLSALLQDFCDLVRGELPLAPADRADAADLAAIAREELARLEDAAAVAGITVEAQIAARAAIAGAARHDLRRLVARLLEQALRFAPRRSTVRFALAREASWWRLAVEDDGPCPLDLLELHRDLDRLGRPDELHGLVPELALAEAWVRALGGHFALRRTDRGGLAVSALLPGAESAP